MLREKLTARLRVRLWKISAGHWEAETLNHFGRHKRWGYFDTRIEALQDAQASVRVSDGDTLFGAQYVFDLFEDEMLDHIHAVIVEGGR